MHVLFITILSTQIVLAADVASVEFFSSNNTQIIDVQTAYERMLSEPQDNLKNEIIIVLQKNHLEQSNYEDILGMYQMDSDQNMTADNTKVFTTSPLQTLPESKAFEIAKELANALKQESIAIFVPYAEAKVGGVVVSFQNNQPSIQELVVLINSKLPRHYAQGFSMRLTFKHAGFLNTKVASVEWLGSKIQVGEIKNAFPLAIVSEQHGNAFLVYKNGQRQEL